ncbi:acyl-CoA synthetase [Mycolicibacterium goodii]|uniref:Acetate--CoA ligase n=1 Tax=Mycolicibacterium goodii TaxID=134601 RepID=A0A0K0X3S4_MYCGD|nr:acetate--CoA ligase [Mycolicibacterium goodii]
MTALSSELTSAPPPPSYRDAVEQFSWDALWDLFEGTRDRLNIAYECLDRHRGLGAAVRLRRSDGNHETLTFDQLADQSARVAHHLENIGVEAGEAVGIMIEPSLEFYAAVFGAMKRGAVAVPLYTLFGPEALKARIDDCGARVLLVGSEFVDATGYLHDVNVIELGGGWLETIADLDTDYEVTTKPHDLAVLQYTSGTSRLLPEAVRHDHRSIVTLTLAGQYGVGLRRGDRFFCPSSPAWGHGLWHGTIAPLSLGISTGAYAGRFDPAELAHTLGHFGITNLAAAGTVYRMLAGKDLLNHLPRLEKASYTGEALSRETLESLEAHLGTPVCGMYGTTETGVILANFPGFDDYAVRPGALGKAVPGWEVAVIDDAGNPVADGVVGEIAVRRRGEWFRSKDLGQRDADGYFWYLGRADDVIISSGWTISPLEVENALCLHPDVMAAAVVGVPDKLRGQALKAFVVSTRNDADMVSELQDMVKTQLSAHEYPRHIEFIAELPTTVNGKINRRALRVQQDDSANSPRSSEWA